MMARIHGLERWNDGIVDNGKPWLDGWCMLVALTDP